MVMAVFAASWLVLARAEPARPVETGQVRKVAGEQSYPWYDPESGRLMPILSQPDLGGGWLDSIGEWLGRKFAWIPRMFERLGRWLAGLNVWRIRGVAGLGDLIAIGLVLMVLAVLIVILLELLRRYRPTPADPLAKSVVLRSGEGARIEGLPAGTGFDASDPWAEAARRRARGDYSGAVVYVFASQLRTLDRLNLIRLVPGRTGRQLVRSVGDRRLRAWVEPTLRLFEAVYYGHRPPSPEAFEAAWTQAEAFQRHLAGGAEGDR